MGALSEAKVLWKTLRGELKAKDYIPPKTWRLRIPNDIGLSLDFPEQVNTPRDRLLYTLWREGEQCYCNLRILTGLNEEKIREALKSLRDEGRIRRRKVPGPAGFEKTDEMSSFSLETG